MSAQEKKNAKSVLFADFAVVKYNTLVDWLQKEGVSGATITDSARFLERIGLEHFDVCVVNLLLGGMGPFEMIANVRKMSKNPDIKIVVVSRQVHKVNIQNTIQAGANDFVAEPFENENLYHRILYHLSPKQILSPEGYEKSKVDSGDWNAVNLMLSSVELLSKTTRNQEHPTFLKILQNVAAFLNSNRTSLIIVEPENNTGVVLASSDDPNFYDFPIALHKYPEILHVMHTGSFVLIDDVSRNAMTKKINEEVKTIQIGSLMVFPVRFQNEIMGVLTVRRQKATEVPPLEVLRIMQALANTMAAHSNVKALLRRIYKDYSLKAVS